jgi:hypothetical protein
LRTALQADLNQIRGQSYALAMLPGTVVKKQAARLVVIKENTDLGQYPQCGLMDGAHFILREDRQLHADPC